MLTFQFSAREAGGALHSGTLKAASSREVAQQLGERGWVPVRIEAAASAATAGAAGGEAHVTLASFAGAMPGLGGLWRRGVATVAGGRRVSPRLQQALGFVLREVAALLKAGVPILRALRLSADASHEPQVRDLLNRMAADLDAGRDLSSAAAREVSASGLFTDYDVAMLRVGERTGRLVEAFQTLHHHREFMRSTREQVNSAVRYPAFVIGTCLIAVVIVNLFVIPQFAKVFKSLHAELPVLTQVLLAFSNFTVTWWPMLLGALALAGVAFSRWTAAPDGRLRWDRLRLRLPLIGPILNGIVVTRFTKSFASSFSAGLTVPQALEVTAQTLGNAHVEAKVRGMVSDLERGTSISQAARSAGVFPPMLLQLIAIGEETGSLDELIGEMAQHYEREVTYSISRLSATIEPLLIWFLGMGVLVLALGVFMPMWELGRASMK